MPGLELHLATRDRSVLEAVGAAYRITNLHASVDEALSDAAFDAAFVHAATAAHPQIVERLLRAGVPVFVDKPLAGNAGEAERLVALSEERGRLLMVGFNRRHAPGYAALREGPHEFCLMQKHRRGPLDSPRRTVFDDFIHVVDTLLFMAPAAPERVTIETIVEGGLLRSVTVMLASTSHVAVGAMNRDSGMDEERLDVIGGGGRRSARDLGEQREQSAGSERVTRRPDWTPVARQRGFETMCADFFQGVRDGRPTASRDIIATHRLCEDIVRQAEAHDPN
jgi:virulence factor